MHVGKNQAWPPSRTVMLRGRKVELRALHSIEEMQHLVDLQAEIWGYGRPGGDFPHPARALFALSESGGLVGGALIENRIVGFSTAWLGTDANSGDPYLHSQLLGILPDLQGLGLGYHLKLQQWYFALNLGLTRVLWTFDPLLSRNARLNIGKLGGIVSRYLPGYYGELNSRFNRGLATDRVWVEWYVQSARVQDRLEGRSSNSGESDSSLESAIKITLDSNGRSIPASCRLDLTSPSIRVEMPDNIGEILLASQGAGLRWQEALRRTFMHYLAAGYRIIDFCCTTGTPRRCFYVLTKSPLEEILGSLEERRGG